MEGGTEGGVGGEDLVMEGGMGGADSMGEDSEVEGGGEGGTAVVDLLNVIPMAAEGGLDLAAVLLREINTEAAVVEKVMAAEEVMAGVDNTGTFSSFINNKLQSRRSSLFLF